MAGGTFTAFDKVRAGAYTNFKSLRKHAISVGNRGVLALCIPLSWGETITKLTVDELINGDSLAKVGCVYADVDAQLLREALKNCNELLVYRMDEGGAKATATIGTLTATAKYAGTAGNKLTVAVVANKEKFDVITLFNLIEKDRQTVKNVSELQDNAFIKFSGAGAVTQNAGTALTGGQNGNVSSSSYTNMFKALKGRQWSTLAIPLDTQSQNPAIIQFIKGLRENEGKAVQAVVYNVDADDMGIISVNQGYETKQGEKVSPTAFVAYYGGLTAGATYTTSNTAHEIKDAVAIIYPNSIEPYDNAKIIEMIKAGKVVLSEQDDGSIMVENDINTLHTFTDEKPYAFSKNRVVRTLDQLAKDINLMYKKGYIGKVSNVKERRDVFKAAVIDYLYKLQNSTAIENFDPVADVSIEAGQEKDIVVCVIAVQPVDSMEKLYTTILVR